MDKFNLKYRLVVQMTQDKAQAIVISSPLTLKAQIKRLSGEGYNTADITIYNLAPESRNAIIKPRYNTTEFTEVKLFAGYDSNNLTQIFVGNLLQAYSIRVGNNIETKILASEAVFAINNAIISATYNKGIDFRQFIMECIHTFIKVPIPTGIVNTNILPGTIGNVGLDRVFSRGISINGNTSNILDKYFKHQVVIDNNFINIMNVNDVFQAYILLISSATGLLNVPVIQNNFLNLEMIFEPQFVIGQFVEVDSIIYPKISGKWKIMGIAHDLEISEGSASKGITKLQLFLGTAILNLINSPS